jgi:hypothetical protein
VIPQELATDCGIATLLDTALLSVLRSDNTALPIELSPKVRGGICIVLISAQSAFLAIPGGIPISQAIIASICSGIVAWGTGGATRSSKTPEKANVSFRPKPLSDDDKTT